MASEAVVAEHPVDLTALQRTQDCLSPAITAVMVRAVDRMAQGRWARSRGDRPCCRREPMPASRANSQTHRGGVRTCPNTAAGSAEISLAPRRASGPPSGARPDKSRRSMRARPPTRRTPQTARSVLARPKACLGRSTRRRDGQLHLCSCRSRRTADRPARLPATPAIARSGASSAPGGALPPIPGESLGPSRLLPRPAPAVGSA